MTLDPSGVDRETGSQQAWVSNLSGLLQSRWVSVPVQAPGASARLGLGLGSRRARAGVVRTAAAAARAVRRCMGLEDYHSTQDIPKSQGLGVMPAGQASLLAEAQAHWRPLLRGQLALHMP